MEFGIKVDDGSELLPELAVEENSKSVKLHDWQNRGIKYFFEHDCRAIFQCATGCITGDTFIELPRDLIKYPNGIPIKNLVGKKDFYVYTFNIKTQQIELKKVKNIWLNKKNADIYEIETKYGKKIKVTDNHPFLVENREWQGQGRKGSLKLAIKCFFVFADTSFDSDIDESLVCSKLCGIEAGLSEDELEELTE